LNDGLDVDDPGETLRRLAIHDDAYIESVLARGFRDTASSGLDAKTQALVRIGALVALGSAPPAYMCAIEAALEAGGTVEEVVGVLAALVPAIGPDRVVAATAGLGLALGYDVDEALERRVG
jgi:alkylhydroperoxidase/carboxymuconolactone decarboxylase family protein YurZ